MKLNIDKIKKELNRRGWSIPEFSAAMKKPRTYGYYLLKEEKGYTHTLDTIDDIAKVLDFDPKDLIIP